MLMRTRQIDHDRDATDERESWRLRREAREAERSGRRQRHDLCWCARTIAPRIQRLLGWTPIYRRGVRNALALRVTHLVLDFPDLPPAFDGYRILHLTDLHLDKIEGTAAAVAGRIAGLTVDLCVITGDIQDAMRGSHALVLDRLAPVLAAVEAEHGFVGVLGNHDSAAMVAPLEAMGVRILINETLTLHRRGAALHLTGLDDVHRFASAQAHAALAATPDGFAIALVHSPEAADHAAERHRLYLCGHTHGGQICLPGGRPIFTSLDRMHHLARGLWRHGEMVGYTSAGLGTSILPLRFNNRGEVVHITLRRSAGYAVVSRNSS